MDEKLPLSQSTTTVDDASWVKFNEQRKYSGKEKLKVSQRNADLQILLCFKSGLVVLAMAHHPQLLADLAPQDNPPVPHNHVLLLGRVGEVVRRLDEVGLDVVLLEVGVPLNAVAVLDLVVAVQVHQGLGGDVNPTDN